MTKTVGKSLDGRPPGGRPTRRSPALELEVEVEIAASPKRVWQVLTDFEAYAEWHPYQTITGPAMAFGRVHVITRKLKSETVRSRTLGVIMRFEKEVALEIVSGNLLLWGERRWYHLQASPRGTLLRHGTRFFGFIARRAFKTTHRIERLRPHFEAVNEAISRRAVSRNWRRTTGGNRHSRRASRAKSRHDG